MEKLAEPEKKIIHLYGYGHAGRRHAKILRDLDCDVAVIDKFSPALKQACEDGFTVKEANGFTEKEKRECDGVVIAVPPEHQADEVTNALQRYSCPIFCEKPGYSSGIERIAELAVDPYCIAVGFQLRAIPSLRDFIEGYSFSDHFIIRDWQDMSAWPTATYGRDILTEFSHEIDIAAWLMPDFERVVASFERCGKLRVKIMAKNGQTCTISIDARYEGYVRDVSVSEKTWQFYNSENEAAYVEQLRAWLDGHPYCTLRHVVKTKRLHDKISVALKKISWLVSL